MQKARPSMDDLNLEEAVDGFGQCGVIAVANTADGGFDACFGQPLGVFDRQILAAAITVVNQPHGLDWATFMDRLLKSIENEASMGRCADAPPDDAPGKGVDDEGDINEPLPGGDIGEV